MIVGKLGLKSRICFAFCYKQNKCSQILSFQRAIAAASHAALYTSTTTPQPSTMQEGGDGELRSPTNIIIKKDIVHPSLRWFYIALCAGAEIAFSLLPKSERFIFWLGYKRMINNKQPIINDSTRCL